MKKQTITKIASLLLPLVAVYFAVSPNSVTVIRAEEVTGTTFAEAVSGSMVGWCAPVALLMIYAIFGAAVINLFAKKQVWMKIIRNFSFIAACLTACPVLIQAEVTVVPNVLVAVVMMVLWGFGYYNLKNAPKEKDPVGSGERLPRH